MSLGHVVSLCVCVAGCRAVPAITNANADQTLDRSIGASVTHTCRNNYFFDLDTKRSTTQITCSSQRTWANLPGHCRSRHRIQYNVICGENVMSLSLKLTRIKKDCTLYLSRFLSDKKLPNYLIVDPLCKNYSKTQHTVLFKLLLRLELIYK